MPAHIADEIHRRHGGVSLFEHVRAHVPALASDFLGLVVFERERYRPEYHYLVFDGATDPALVREMVQFQGVMTAYADLRDRAPASLVVVVASLQ